MTSALKKHDMYISAVQIFCSEFVQFRLYPFFKQSFDQRPFVIGETRKMTS